MQAGEAFVDVKAFSRERARPLAPEDRREAILLAVVPLLREHGRDVSTRQIAEAAGVAEGTLFRAFGDKDSLIAAAIEKILDHRPLLAALSAIDVDQPLEDKLEQVIDRLKGHFRDVVAAFAALELRERPSRSARTTFERGLVDVLATLLAADTERLAVPVETVAEYVRIVAFASALPIASGLGTDVLSGLIARGIIRREEEN
jgi:AcrR family transcriptional regulator